MLNISILDPQNEISLNQIEDIENLKETLKEKEIIENIKVQSKSENNGTKSPIEKGSIDPDWIPDEEGSMNSNDSYASEMNNSAQNIEKNVNPVSEVEKEIRDQNEIVIKKRRKIKCPENWHDIKNKRLREEGKAYVGWSRNKGQKHKRGADREARQMGPRCTSRLCEKSKIRNCSKMTDDERKLLFNHFWSKMSWDQRKVYICSLVTQAPTKRSPQ